VSHRAGAAAYKGGSRTRYAAIAIAVAAAVSLSACADGGTKADPSARAELDQSTGRIKMPISEYDIADPTTNLDLLNQALYIYVGECMTEQGLGYPAEARTSGTEYLVDDRPYGLWWEPGVLEWGISYPPNKVDLALDDARKSGGSRWSEIELDCFDRAAKDPELKAIIPSNESLNDSIVSSVRTDAYRLASADPAWQAARELWWACLRDEGLEPLTGASEWGAAPSADPESEFALRAALIEVRCNNEIQLTQILGDLEASYQQPLIDKNQAALNEWKQDKQDRLDAARDYIARNG